MLGTIIRHFRGEVAFKVTIFPEKYNVGSVVAVSVGKRQHKAFFRVTGKTPIVGSNLYTLWGMELPIGKGEIEALL